jgi:A/G-specific adenine glycosylase
MPGMLELPVLPLKAVQGREPELRLRHSITNTNFRVQIYADITLRDTLPAAKQQLEWTLITRLHELPLTGLARKALQRLRVMPMMR